MGSMKVQDSSIVHNQAITTLCQDDEFSFRQCFPKLILWSLILLFVMVHNAYIFIVVVILFGAVNLIINLISSPSDKLHFSFNSLYDKLVLLQA
ncbi:hypothetical protein ACE6H2_008673 [Prunus campanulata]